CSTASSCCSPARGSWTGSATSSWTASLAASTRTKYAMQQLGYGATHGCLRLDAFQNDTMQSGSEVQFVLAWSVSFQKQLLKRLRVAWIKTRVCFVEVHMHENKQLP